MADKCNVCCIGKELKVCSGCNTTLYCSDKCQVDDWSAHQLICNGTKRKFGDDDGMEDENQRRRYVAPKDRYLDPRLRDQLTNPRFLRDWVQQNTMKTIMKRVYNADVGFYGALNESNLFWYFVYLEKHPYNPLINYREEIKPIPLE